MQSIRLALPLFGLAALLLPLLLPRAVAADQDADATDRARKFLDAYTAKMRPLEIAANRAWWNANITGKDEDYVAKEKAQNESPAEWRGRVRAFWCVQLAGTGAVRES